MSLGLARGRESLPWATPRAISGIKKDGSISVSCWTPGRPGRAEKRSAFRHRAAVGYMAGDDDRCRPLVRAVAEGATLFRPTEPNAPFATANANRAKRIDPSVLHHVIAGDVSIYDFLAGDSEVVGGRAKPGHDTGGVGQSFRRVVSVVACHAGLRPDRNV
jgi:hypothetical protein